MNQVLFRDIAEIVTMKKALSKQGRQVDKKDLSLVKNGAMAVDGGVIQWIGKENKIPPTFKKFSTKSLKGKNVFPGFVDCHTHLIFAGDRKDEFELRNQGVSYQEIARRGGGILSTVKATRKASLDKLVELGQQRVASHLKQGVTTVEIKSGYGLNKSSEEKMLKAAQALKKINVVTTFLGAHAIPQNYKNESQYLAQLKKDLSEIKNKGLSQRVDIFIEKNYFSFKMAKEYLTYAQSLGFKVTIHADQLSRSKASLLAIELGALSADHVICLSAKDKKALAQSETTAVLLPCADFYLQCDYPDARQLIDQGGRVALATDFNPGSSPTQSLSLLGVLARLQMKMTLAEVFSGLTVGAAFALGVQDKKGALVTGHDADFFVSEKSWQNFFYDMSPVPVESTYIKAKKVY